MCIYIYTRVFLLTPIVGICCPCFCVGDGCQCWPCNLSSIVQGQPVVGSLVMGHAHWANQTWKSAHKICTSYQLQWRH